MYRTEELNNGNSKTKTRRVNSATMSLILPGEKWVVCSGVPKRIK